jgi:hypothetical protein
MNDLLIDYHKCRHLIQDADVLFFVRPKFPKFGWWVGKYTQSPYSHVALAYKEDGNIRCIEFREFRGSRVYPIENYLYSGHQIHVFRAASILEHPVIEHSHNRGYFLDHHPHVFNNNVSNGIISTALGLVDQKYSWHNILSMGMTYIPFLRLFANYATMDDKWNETHSFVCSTLVTYCYRKHFIDPVPFVSDRFTTPGDLARSRIFFKLFEIRLDKNKI